MIAYSTDAPIYHPPLATIGLIIANVLLFFAFPPGAEPTTGPEHGQVERERNEWDAADFIDPEGGAAAAKEPVPNDARDPNQGPRQRLALRLHFGSWNPLQWFTAPLLHEGFLQLLLNMVALWAFGLVVEGKVGALSFVGLYFGIAITQAAVMQTLMLFASGSFGGANAAVLGLLGIAVVWAPKNSFDVWFGMYFGVHEVSILIYGFIQFALITVVLCLGDNGFATGLTQLLGFGLGLGAGLVWLRRGWVDCEGWDLLQVLKGDHGKTLHETDEEVERAAQQLIRATRNSNTPRSVNQLAPPEADAAEPAGRDEVAPKQPSKRSIVRRKASRVAAATETQPPAVPFDPLEDVQQLLAADNHQAALKLLRKHQQAQPELELPQPALAQLMRCLLIAKDYPQAALIMEEHIRRFPKNRSKVQLHLARVRLTQERPQKAIAVLKEVDRASLDEAALQQWQQLAALAKQQIDDGVIELSD